MWTIGDSPRGRPARLTLNLRVNATGSIDLRGAITGSSQPDPNLANNVIVPERINRPPVANAGADQAVSTNGTVLLDGSGSFDADGDPVTYEWTFTLRPVNSAATFAGAATAATSFVPDQGGHYVAQLRLRDSFGVFSVPDTATITAAVTNRSPLFASLPVTVAAVGQAYRYAVAVSDPDAGDALVLSLVNAPAGMAIDPVTGVITWTPGDGQGGPQPVTVRVQDTAGLFVTQAFTIQVSSSANGAPVAADDHYSVRIGESLGVSAPGLTANDTDESPLTATLVSPPGNGTVSLNPDGSFTYTPHTLQPGELVLAENVNLAARMPGVTVSGGGCPACAVDEDNSTKWDAFSGTLQIQFPSDVTVSQLRLVGTRILNTERTTAGRFELLGANDVIRYASGPVEIPGPLFDATLVLPNLTGVRRVRFTPTATTGNCTSRVSRS